MAKTKRKIVMRNRYKQSIGLCLIALILINWGCARSNIYLIEVDSYSANKRTANLKYILLPSDKDTSASDLKFQEYARYVHHALADEGFIKASSVDDADIVIFFAHGVGEPKEHVVTSSVPVYGRKGIKSSKTQGRVDVLGNTATYSEDTTYQRGGIGIIGYRSKKSRITTYKRFLMLEAYDLNMIRKTKTVKSLWRTEVTSSGASDDYRLVLPFLLKASRPYFGKSTGRKVKVTLSEDDEDVAKLRQLIPRNGGTP